MSLNPMVDELSGMISQDTAFYMLIGVGIILIVLFLLKFKKKVQNP